MKLTFSLRVSRVKTLAVQDAAKAWKAAEAAYFTKSSDLQKTLNPRSSSLKTLTLSEAEDYQKFCKNCPSQGMTIAGVYYPLKKLAHRIKDNGGFASHTYPTPTASQASKPIRPPSPSRLSGNHGWDLQDKLGQMGLLLPTPTAIAAVKEQRISQPVPSDKNGRTTVQRMGKIYPSLIGMKINPLFLEWMMGFPTGWTEINALATQLFLCKQE